MKRPKNPLDIRCDLDTITNMKATTVIVRVTKRVSKAYLMTIPNTDDGRELFKLVNAAFKAEGKYLTRCGRGSRKAAFFEAAQNPKNWEHRVSNEFPNARPWLNGHYRPKLGLKACTRFDVYFR